MEGKRNANTLGGLEKSCEEENDVGKAFEQLDREEYQHSGRWGLGMKLAPGT